MRLTRLLAHSTNPNRSDHARCRFVSADIKDIAPQMLDALLHALAVVVAVTALAGGLVAVFLIEKLVPRPRITYS